MSKLFLGAAEVAKLLQTEINFFENSFTLQKKLAGI